MVALPQLRAWEHVMLKPSHPAALQAPGSKMPLGRRPDALTRQEAEVLTEAKRAWLEQHPYRAPSESFPSTQPRAKARPEI